MFNNLKSKFNAVVYGAALTIMTAVNSLTGQTIIAGNGSMGCDNTNGVPGTSIPLDAAKGVAIDDVGRVIFTEDNCGLVKRVEMNGLITVMADMPGQNFEHVDYWGGETRTVTSTGDLYIITENGNGTFNVSSGGNLGTNIQEYEYTPGFNWTLKNGGLYKNGVFFGGAGVVNDISTTTGFPGQTYVYVTSTDNAVGYYSCTSNGCFGTNIGFLNNPVAVGTSKTTGELYVVQQNGDLFYYDLNNGNEFQNIGAISGTVTDFDVNDAGEFAVSKIMYVAGTLPIILPVTFTSIDARQNNDGVLVSWGTASEVNNDRFEVERSIDGKNWEKIGQVKGAGNSQTQQSYEFLDKKAANGLNRYRAKQVDLDEKFAYSDIASVKVTGRDNKITVFPNPANDRIMIKGLNEETGYSVTLTNLATTQTFNLKAANDGFIDVSGLTSGIYNLGVTGTAQQENLKLVLVP